MASCLHKIPSENESRAEGENDEMGLPNYRERSRLNKLLISYRKNNEIFGNQQYYFVDQIFGENDDYTSGSQSKFKGEIITQYVTFL